MFASSSNAYMLMYRQIDKSRNSNFMDFDNFPPHIKSTIDNLKKEEDDQKRTLEYERTTYRFKLFGYHPVRKIVLEKKFDIHKDKTLNEAVKIAHQVICILYTRYYIEDRCYRTICGFILRYIYTNIES